MIISFILGVLTSIGTLHPFHVSVCDVEYKEESKALQFSYHMFLDDLEEAMKKKYDPTLDITSPQNELERDRYVKAYLLENFTVEVNGKRQEINYLGHELEEGAMYSYMEIEGIKKLKSLVVKCTILTDTFDDQVNLIHIKVDGRTKSLKLDKKNFYGQIVYEN